MDFLDKLKGIVSQKKREAGVPDAAAQSETPDSPQKESYDADSVLAQLDKTVPARPMVKLTPKRAEQLSVYASKLGGLPYLPKAHPYPMGKSGAYENRPLRLLMQLNFSELPHVPDFPETGILQIFCSDDDDENVYGMDFDNGTNQNGFRVLYHKEILHDESLLRTAEDMPVCDGESLFPFEGEYLLEASEPEMCSISLDDYRGHVAMIDWCNSKRTKQISDFYELYSDESEDADALNEVWEQITEMRSNSGTHLGGYPYFTQQDPRDTGKYSEYDTLLFQCDSEYDKEQGIDILWGDMGVANFFIPGEKLRQLDFSDVLFNWDCC